MLVPGDTPVKRTIGSGNEQQRNAGVEGSRIKVSRPGGRKTIAVLSMPALQAARCVRLQSEEAFRRFHLILFRAYYDEGRNISEREVLISLIAEAGLDVEQFTAEFDGGRQKAEVSAEHDDYVQNWGPWGIPLVIVSDHYPILEAVSLDLYRRAIDRLLSD